MDPEAMNIQLSTAPVRHVACQSCRLAHTACDGQRPCRRCVGMNRANDCVDAVPKKRGRPVGKKNGGEKEGEGGLFHFTFQAPKRAKTSKKSSSQAEHDDAQSMSEHGISGPHNPFPGEATPHVDSQSTSRAFTSPPPAPTVAPTPSEPRSGMLESVLTLLVEEMRELKKSNMALHNEVRQLREKQQETDDKIERLNQNASRQRVVDIPNNSLVSATSAYRELFRMMPFLSQYRINNTFVIDDMRKPFVAMRIPQFTSNSKLKNWGVLPCGLLVPMIISANRVFCSVFQQPLKQLLGSPFSSVCRNETNDRIICRFARRAPQDPAVSDIYEGIWTSRPPNGDVRHLKARLQMFYGPDGQAKWIITCFDSMVEQKADNTCTTITFPSPLLSCLAEDEAGCNGNTCIISGNRLEELSSSSLVAPSPDDTTDTVSPSSGFFLSTPTTTSSSPNTDSSPLSIAGTTPLAADASPWPSAPSDNSDSDRFQPLSQDSLMPTSSSSSVRPQSDDLLISQQRQLQQEMDTLLQEPLFVAPSPVSPFLGSSDDLTWLLSSRLSPPARFQE